MVMKEQTFLAILAKNQIARQIRNKVIEPNNQLISCLKDIEKEIGTGNQPSIEDIINHDESL